MSPILLVVILFCLILVAVLTVTFLRLRALQKRHEALQKRHKDIIVVEQHKKKHYHAKSLVRAGITSEDMALYATYIQKQDRHFDNTQFWAKLLVTLNFGLFTGVAFLLIEWKSIEVATGHSFVAALTVLAIGAFGFFMSLVWIDLHDDNADWLFRMNAIIENVENEILRNPKGSMLRSMSNDSGTQSEIQDKSLEGFGMWNMINAFVPTNVAAQKHSKRDGIFSLGSLPEMFASMWACVGGFGLIVFVIKILEDISFALSI